jgi:hypothetical protein
MSRSDVGPLSSRPPLLPLNKAMRLVIGRMERATFTAINSLGWS